MKHASSISGWQQVRNQLSDICLDIVELPAASGRRQAKLFPLAAILTRRLGYGEMQQVAFDFLEHNLNARFPTPPYTERLLERLFKIAENEKLAEAPRVTALDFATRIIGEDFSTHNEVTPRLEAISNSHPDMELGNYARHLREQLIKAHRPGIDFKTYRPDPYKPLYENMHWGRARNGEPKAA